MLVSVGTKERLSEKLTCREVEVYDEVRSGVLGDSLVDDEEVWRGGAARCDNFLVEGCEIGGREFFSDSKSSIMASSLSVSERAVGYVKVLVACWKV